MTMSTELATLDVQDADSLKLAHELMENPGLVARLSNMIGEPIEAGMQKLPHNVQKIIGEAVEKAINAAFRIALKTMDTSPSEAKAEPKKTGWWQKAVSSANDAVGGVFGVDLHNANDDGEPPRASNLLHQVASAASGAVGGAFGLAAMPIELPISTTIMMRSIADIARSEGENLSDRDTQVACIQVLAFGGKSKNDDGAEVGYFAVRQTMAAAVTDAVTYLAKSGTDTTAPALIQLIRQIGQRFGVLVGDKAAAQLVPIIGAASGAAINTMFMNHFQDMARGHFTVRRLERKYGADRVQAEYERLTILATNSAESREALPCNASSAPE